MRPGRYGPKQIPKPCSFSRRHIRIRSLQMALMFANNSADPYAFADYIDAKYGEKLKCCIPKVMEKTNI